MRSMANIGRWSRWRGSSCSRIDCRGEHLSLHGATLSRMRRHWIAPLCALAAVAGTANGDTRRIVFENSSEQAWAEPALPADWSPYRFLVMELRLSSPQRFDLRVHDATGVRQVRLAPVAGVWIRAAVPLAFMTQPAGQGHDLASVHNKSRPRIFINLSGTSRPLEAVQARGLA